MSALGAALAVGKQNGVQNDANAMNHARGNPSGPSDSDSRMRTGA
jgi:hypothetical protein